MFCTVYYLISCSYLYCINISFKQLVFWSVAALPPGPSKLRTGLLYITIKNHVLVAKSRQLLETAASPLLAPTTTLNLKSPLPRCHAHGEYPLWVKPGTLTPPSPPLFAPPLIEGCGHSRPLPRCLH